MTIKEQRLFVLLSMIATLLCGLLGCQSTQPVSSQNMSKSVNINPMTATATVASYYSSENAVIAPPPTPRILNFILPQWATNYWWREQSSTDLLNWVDCSQEIYGLPVPLTNILYTTNATMMFYRMKGTTNA